MPIHDWTRVTAGVFHYFHVEWMTAITRGLNAGLLPPNYYAMAEQIVGGVEPDVVTFHRADLTPQAQAGNGTLLVETQPLQAEEISTLQRNTIPHTSRHITIRDKQEHRLVAAIEIVSPGNKSSRDALRSFVRKVAEFIEGGVHILILDLFPPGLRDPNGIHSLIWSEIGGPEYSLRSTNLLTFVSYSSDAEHTAYIRTSTVGGEPPDMPLFLTSRGHIIVPVATTYQAAFDVVPSIVAPPAG